MKTTLVKLGEEIHLAPKGVDYSLIPGTIYNLCYDRYEGKTFLKINGDFNMPSKVFNTDEDEVFMNRVLKYHETSNKQTTGVLLNGVKGTGKTVMAKQIAVKSGLPCIIVDNMFPTKVINKFFTEISEPVCVIIDEFEKFDDTSNLLQFLDGVEKTTKKLVLLTSNEINKVSTYLLSRPSRIRYIRSFSDKSDFFIKNLIIDYSIEDTDNRIYNFIIDRLTSYTMDNVSSFLEEYKIFKDELSLNQILDGMNISYKESTNVVADDEDKNDDDFQIDVCLNSAA